MTTVRFLSPEVPQLVLAGVPATFVNGICDIDDSDPDRLSRMRYLGTPYGVIEMGAVTEADPTAGTTMTAIIEALDNPSSDLSLKLAELYVSSAELQTVTDDLAQVKQQVESLADGAGGNRFVVSVGTPTTYDASGLPDNTLVALMTSDPTIS